MPRITPLPVDPAGNAVTNSVLARVMGRRPEILKAFARLDAATRFHGVLSPSLKEALRSATADDVGCAYCASLSGGTGRPDEADQRESLAVAFAQMIAQDPAGITDAQFDVLRAEFTEDEIVELVAFVCLVGVAGQMFGAVMGLEAADPAEAAEYQAVITGRG